MDLQSRRNWRRLPRTRPQAELFPKDAEGNTHETLPKTVDEVKNLESLSRVKDENQLLSSAALAPHPQPAG